MEDRKTGIQSLIIGISCFVPLAAGFCFETMRTRLEQAGGLSLTQMVLLIFAGMALAMCVFGAGVLYRYYTKGRGTANHAGGSELIRRFYSLLECGAITHREFDEIKKKVLKGQVK